MNKKKKFNLLNEYKKCWDYIRESKNFIYSIIGVFMLFVLIGIFVPAPQIFYEKIMEFLRELLKETENLSLPELIRFIAFNNIRSTFLGIFLGIFFGIYPLISAISNGYLLGFVSLISINSDGGLSLWRILPHGIFELPAVFISLGIGLFIGYQSILFLYNFIKYHKKSSPLWLLIILVILFPLPFLIIAYITDIQQKRFSKELNYSIINSLRIFFLVILPLLVIAGIIEGTFMILVK